MRILVVDDDPVILDMLPTFLREEGHHDISIAASGAAALDILSCCDEVFDVLILDIMMPDIDGVALCAKIREMPPYSSTPILMLTAKSDSRVIESAFAAGANDYITKPFDIKGIGRRLQVAERLMREGCKVISGTSLMSPLPDTFGTSDFPINEPVRISGLDQHTDPFSLGNYLSQLARSKVRETSVFAVGINAFEEQYDEWSPRELLLVIAEVSNAISAAANDTRLLHAYNGLGTFICIAADDMLDVWLEMERRADDYLKRSNLLRTANFPHNISVTMGRPFRPNANKTQRVRPTFDRAISLLQRRLEFGGRAI